MGSVTGEDGASEWALVGIGGALDGQRFAISRQAAAGSDPANDVPFQGDGVAEVHAQFAVVAGHLSVKDMGGPAGTRLNGSVVERALLEPGDTLTFGPQDFRVDGPSMEAQAAAGNLDQTIITGASESIARQASAPPDPVPQAPIAAPEKSSSNGLLIGGSVVLAIVVVAVLFM